MGEADPFIRFYCDNCGYKSTVSESYAGKEIRCPKCYNRISIPTIESTDTTSQSSPGKPETPSKYSNYDLALLNISEKEEIRYLQNSIYEETDEYEQEPGEQSRAKTESFDERKLPWFVDVLLYPVSLHGIIQIIIFLVGFVLINLISMFIFMLLPPQPGGQHYGGLLIAILRALLIGYIIYYFGYCVFDSSRGGWRAPDIRPEHIPDKWDCILQVFLILGCVAICFSPVSVYYGFTRRTDLTYWILAGCGGFFFPMVLLRGVLFDSFDALNPISIIGSILRTFFAYCGLILSFSVFGGFVALIFWIIGRVPIPGFVSDAIGFYLLFVAAHLLGRFYWRHKDKLDWGI